MKYSTKIGIAVGIGFAFIIIMAIVMFIFVRNNSTSETSQETTDVSDEETETIEEFTNEINLYEIASLGINQTDEGTYLVKITDDLEEEAFVNLEQYENLEFVGYDYSDGKVYIMYDNSGTLQVSSIDLENYEAEIVAELNNDFVNSFTVYDDKIYYISDSAIYEYDIESATGLELFSMDYDETITNLQFDKNNNIIYYMKNVISDESSVAYVYKMDLSSETTEEILNIDTEGNEILLKDNYLVCNILNVDEESGMYSTNYLYNIEDNSICELGSNNSVKAASTNIAFTDEYIIISDGEKLVLKNYDGDSLNDELFVCEEADEEILDIFMLSSDKLQIRISENSEDVSQTYIIDFTYDILEEASSNYYNILSME